MVGRVEERIGLESAYGADESEFVAVYGRRRVGKTYLVSETFRGKFSFRHAGLKDATMREQLESFRESLVDFGHSKCPELKGWLQAFRELEVLLSRKKAARRVRCLAETIPTLSKKRIRLAQSSPCVINSRRASSFGNVIRRPEAWK